ncbi:MAG: Kelch repeat-containing protein, partial [Actinomycetes bacterium]
PIQPLPRMTLSRAAHTATALPDGRVLVAGGCTADGCEGATRGARSELFEPERRAFVAGPAMTTPRAGHTATPLPGGAVLIVGGYTGEGAAPLASAEVFDPGEGSFRGTASMSVGRGAHSAVALSDGRVLVMGGVSGAEQFLDSAEMYDPRTGRWTRTGPMTTARSAAAAVALADGRVLVTGGQAVAGEVLDTAEVFDPASGRWRRAGRLTDGRYKHAASLLADGRVLVVGGSGPGDQAEQLASAELYDPSSNRFSATGSMQFARFKIPDAVAIGPDGRVVVAGGASTVEVFDPVAESFTPMEGRLGDALSFSTATVLGDGRVLVLGGYDASIAARSDAYLLDVSP